MKKNFRSAIPSKNELSKHPVKTRQAITTTQVKEIAAIVPLVRPDPEYGLPPLASRLEWIPDRLRRYWDLPVPGHAPLSRLGPARIL